MVSENFHVEVIGHATLQICYGGRTLLTDPWLVDPIGLGSGFHFPPLVHDSLKLAGETDAIYISHVHPDHFHPPTLRLFPKHIPVYIGEYRRKEFREEVRRLGFPVIEVPFQQLIAVQGTDFEIAILEHDYQESAAYDSALVVRTPRFTLFENNDCFLRPEKYRWVREHFDVDYAFLGYSPASFFPICFEMDADEKARLLAEAAERRYADFIDAARLLSPRLSVPFASGARFLHPDTLWKNISFNSAHEAVARLRRVGLIGEVMGPGDRITDDGCVRRVSQVFEKSEELAAIERYARSVEDWVRQVSNSEAPPRPDIIETFREYILGLWQRTRDKLPGVRNYVIAYRLVGAVAGEFYFDFSRPEEEIFQWGQPARYDMRYTYPSGALQMKLDGALSWDEFHFMGEVSVHQVRYAKDFYMMLRSQTLDLG